MNIRKRYSEFDDFRHHLVQAFPSFEAAVPALPPKSVIAKFRPNFLEKRRAGLQYFLKYVSPPFPPKTKEGRKKGPESTSRSLHDHISEKGQDSRLTGYFPPSLSFSCILLNPEFSGSPVLKDFLFS